MNEVSLKPVIEELENLFSKFNARFFADKLEKPVITVSPDHTRGAYGWCTGWKAWKAGEDEGHYTLPQLRVILESLCGAGNYSADVADYTLLVKVGVAAKKNFQDVQTLLKRVAPVNLVLVVQQLFNIHQVLGGFTHAQLAWYTHSEVRTEELQTHECTPHKTLRPFTHAQLGGLENKSIRKEMTDGTVHT